MAQKVDFLMYRNQNLLVFLSGALFLKKCNKDFTSVKTSLFLSPLPFCFLSVSLNVAADNKDEEIRVAPRRSYLGTYHAT